MAYTNRWHRLRTVIRFARSSWLSMMRSNQRFKTAARSECHRSEDNSDGCNVCNIVYVYVYCVTRYNTAH